MTDVTYDKLRYITNEVIDLVLRKNADYGGAWEKYGIAGVAVRLGDKALRLEKLSDGREALVVDEGVHDTLEDVMGYCMLGLLYLAERTASEIAKLPKAVVTFDTEDVQTLRKNMMVAAASIPKCFACGDIGTHSRVEMQNWTNVFDSTDVVQKPVTRHYCAKHFEMLESREQ